MAIASSRPFTLLDSVAKKGQAVASVLAEVDCVRPRPEIAQMRAEELAAEHGAQYAVIVARAVAPLPALVELAAPLLVSGGHLIALKGCPDLAERASGAAVAALVGMRELSWRELRLPRGGEARTICAYVKASQPTVRLPRRVGLAQHSPLA